MSTEAASVYDVVAVFPLTVRILVPIGPMTITLALSRLALAVTLTVKLTMGVATHGALAVAVNASAVSGPTELGGAADGLSVGLVLGLGEGSALTMIGASVAIGGGEA